MKQKLVKKRSEEGTSIVSRVLYKEGYLLNNKRSDAALADGSG